MDRALQEFISEAQEIIETLSRDLLALDAARGGGRFDPDVLNDAFRAVHSLKGLAGLFALDRMTALSHGLETLLDQLRLGRVPLRPEILDVLFEAVELYNRMIAAAADGRPSDDDVDAFLARLEVASAGKAKAASRAAPALGAYELDPSVLAVLTEYEEHRLRENIRSGRRLWRVHAAFDLMSIDKGLDELKGRLKPIGEVITYLPSPEAPSDQHISLDVIVASDQDEAAVSRAVEGTGARVSEVARTRFVDTTPAPAAPSSSVTAPPTAPIVRAAPGDEEDEEARSLRSVSQTVRVDIRKLDHLMNIVGELALARAGIVGVLDELRGRKDTTELARTLHRESRNLERKLDELQSGILEVRMVPLGQVFDKLSRVVRKVSREAGKDIRLTIGGAETELDKLIVEELSDPLMHIMRNSIDHGIEDAEVRRRAGKPAQGHVSIVAEPRGNHVVLTISDDGGGFDEEKILETALKKGLVDTATAAEMSRRELLNLVFLPGFSTRETATELSGRGVGMDVVKTNISRLSGIIDLQSHRGRGTTISITLPITLAIIQALVVRVTGRIYAVPLSSVLESVAFESSDVRTIEGREVMTLRGHTLTLSRVEEFFALTRTEPRPDKGFIVVVGLAQHRLGLVVDELVGQQDIVIKSLGKALAGIPGIAGATELGGQQIVLVLDVGALVEEALRVGASEAA